eukprot:CAMPEP_0172300106 /NCGR_PEP_ID=MMETSP1058-20130122/2279_1 /TAXON_ID=83371 /ORGANISM="Detonula confervacea, Strain CCMP 353" /LENGTH=448 /DNA_ID=CAMNT_0013009797 /DNA_START=673 /DNA_END=2019 /DNA_ORIENTATION=+
MARAKIVILLPIAALLQADAFIPSAIGSFRTKSTTELYDSSRGIERDDVPSVPMPPWYSDSSILRDRSHVIPTDRGFDYRATTTSDDDDIASSSSSPSLSQTVLDVLSRPTSKVIPFQGNNAFVRRLEGEANTARGVVEPLFLSFNECDPSWLCDNEGTISWLGQQSINEGDDGTSNDDDEKLLDYFAIDIPLSIDVVESSTANVLTADGVESSTVRNYGDTMRSRTHAALLATANGLFSFHRTHRFCSKCGSQTSQIKAGSARKCTSESCKTSVYPRIDPAVIMLITSPCGNYAVLGRKKTWPQGRYSTLAGFLEVGETLEECVVRETLEDSGVCVDPASVRFVASQPWPFPRSMMVGFHGAAAAGPGDVTRKDNLPELHVDPAELEDARWFSKEYVRKNGLIEGRGSSALDFEPDDNEAEFHVPGPASLARLLITQWVLAGDDPSL